MDPTAPQDNQNNTPQPQQGVTPPPQPDINISAPISTTVPSSSLPPSPIPEPTPTPFQPPIPPASPSIDPFPPTSDVVSQVPPPSNNPIADQAPDLSFGAAQPQQQTLPPLGFAAPSKDLEADPVQPGQFVIAEGPESNSSLNISPKEVDPLQPTFAASAIPPEPPAPQPMETLTPPGPTTFAPQSEFQMPPPPQGLGQPDPTPFSAPDSQAHAAPAGSIFGKMKTLAVVSGIVVLVSIIAGVGSFFLLKDDNKAATTSADQGTQLEELPPLPKRSAGGFGDIPPAPPEAATTEAAPPAQPLP